MVIEAPVGDLSRRINGARVEMARLATRWSITPAREPTRFAAMKPESSLWDRFPPLS
jgi:hypothetical protein